MHDLRTSNIGLARYLTGGHNNLAKKLAGLTNACYVSEMAHGRRLPSSYELRTFERRLNFPTGWFERDNEFLLRISDREFLVLTKVLALSEQKQVALIALLADSKEKPT